MMSALRTTMLRHIRGPEPRAVTRIWSRGFHVEHPDPSVEKQIKSAAEDIILNYPHKKSVYGALLLVNTHPTVKSSSGAYNIRIMSYMLELMTKDPEFDQLEVFRQTPVIYLYCSSDGTEDFTKEEVTSMVFQVAKSYPYICPSKMTEEAHWDRDLGMHNNDIVRVTLCLQFLFKLIISESDAAKLNSVRSASEYIYNHLGDRLHRTEFLKERLKMAGEDGVEPELQDDEQILRERDDKYGEGKEQIMKTVLEIVQSNPEIKSPYKVLNLVDEHPKVKMSWSSHTFKLNVLWKIFEHMLKDPNLDPVLAHTARVVVSLHSSDETVDYTKDEVISKVLAVVKSYRKVCPSKVTEEANFSKDLGLDAKGYKNIFCHLQYEFKLFIPHGDAAKINSVKSASDYIYDHLDQRESKQEIVKKVSFINHDDDDLFW